MLFLSSHSNNNNNTSCRAQELNKMSKRYATVNTLGAGTPMPLLGWLTRELDINHHDLRSVSGRVTQSTCAEEENSVEVLSLVSYLVRGNAAFSPLVPYLVSTSAVSSPLCLHDRLATCEDGEACTPSYSINRRKTRGFRGFVSPCNLPGSSRWLTY